MAQPQQQLRIDAPFDPYCNRTPAQIPDVVDHAADYGLTPDDYIRQHEGTFNHSNGHFACTECYIKLGMPSAPAPRGWKAD